MKKNLLWLLPLCLGACSDDGESPVITVEKLYVTMATSHSDEKINYAHKQEEIPTLKTGDEIEAILYLNGNGADLKTFTLINDKELKVNHILFDKSDISTEGNLTNESKGQYRFKDGVRESKVMVKAVIDRVNEEEGKLSFYLSSKAECEGAEEEIELKLQLNQ